MSRKERSRAADGRLAQLLAAGAHGAVRREARAVLADPAATDAERASAASALAALAPERGAAVVGLVGTAVAVAVALWAVVRGGP
jgi:hypothetical protein